MFSSLARSPLCICKQSKNNIATLARSHSRIVSWYKTTQPCIRVGTVFPVMRKQQCNLVVISYVSYSANSLQDGTVMTTFAGPPRAVTSFFDSARLATQQYKNAFCAPSCLSLLTTVFLTLQVRTSLSLCIPDSNSTASLVSEHYAHSSRYTCSTSSPALPARSPSSLILAIDTSRY